jgi:hypothetical protein
MGVTLVLVMDVTDGIPVLLFCPRVMPDMMNVELLNSAVYDVLETAPVTGPKVVVGTGERLELAEDTEAV